MWEKGTVILCSLTTQAHKVVYLCMALHETGTAPGSTHMILQIQHYAVVSTHRDHAQSASAASQSLQPVLAAFAAGTLHHRLAEPQVQQVFAADTAIELGVPVMSQQ